MKKKICRNLIIYFFALGLPLQIVERRPVIHLIVYLYDNSLGHILVMTMPVSAVYLLSNFLMGHRRPIFLLFLVLFEQILQQSYVKNVHSLHGAGIQTHNLQK